MTEQEKAIISLINAIEHPDIGQSGDPIAYAKDVLKKSGIII